MAGQAEEFAKRPKAAPGVELTVTSDWTMVREPLGLMASAVIKYTFVALGTIVAHEAVVITTSEVPFQHTGAVPDAVDLT